MKTCTKCNQSKPLTEFSKDKQKRDGFRSICKPCNREIAKLWELRTKETRAERAKIWQAANRTLINNKTKEWRQSGSGSISEMLSQARKRAKAAGIQFTVTATDVPIPELCPIFGKPLVRKDTQGPGPWSPSLDKIIPANGYTPGNVMVISHKANVMKNNATPEELLLFADWIYKTFGLLRK